MIDTIYCDRCGRYLGGEFDIRYGKFKCRCGHTTVIDYRKEKEPLTKYKWRGKNS